MADDRLTSRLPSSLLSHVFCSHDLRGRRLTAFGRAASPKSPHVRCIIHTSCAVGVWGRLAALEDLLVSPMQGDKVALHGRKRTIFGGFATLQTSPQQATA